MITGWNGFRFQLVSRMRGPEGAKSLAWDDVRASQEEKKREDIAQLRLSHPHLAEWKEVRLSNCEDMVVLTLREEGKTARASIPLASVRTGTSFRARTSWHMPDPGQSFLSEAADAS